MLEAQLVDEAPRLWMQAEAVKNYGVEEFARRVAQLDEVHQLPFYSHNLLDHP